MGEKKSKETQEFNWRDEWKDMPEFVQEDRESIKGVTVHFETAADMEEFSKLIGITITMKTKGVFYPVRKHTKKEYRDES